MPLETKSATLSKQRSTRIPLLTVHLRLERKKRGQHNGYGEYHQRVTHLNYISGWPQYLSKVWNERLPHFVARLLNTAWRHCYALLVGGTILILLWSVIADVFDTIPRQSLKHCCAIAWLCLLHQRKGMTYPSNTSFSLSFHNRFLWKKENRKIKVSRIVSEPAILAPF